MRDSSSLLVSAPRTSDRSRNALLSDLIYLVLTSPLHHHSHSHSPAHGMTWLNHAGRGLIAAKWSWSADYPWSVIDPSGWEVDSGVRLSFFVLVVYVYLLLLQSICGYINDVRWKLKTCLLWDIYWIGLDYLLFYLLALSNLDYYVVWAIDYCSLYRRDQPASWP